LHHTRKIAGAALLGLLLGLVSLQAAEVIPPKPAGYFNDYAGVVSKDSALRFNEQLAQFERETSNQVVVAVFRKMQTDSDIADYTQRIFQAWEIGSRETRNGVLFIVFVEDRKMRIQTGYGVEGALPDVTAFDITERRVKPQFRTGGYEAGLAVGIDSIMKAIRGEYKGSGKTVAESEERQNQGGIPCIVLFFIFIILLIVIGQMGGRGRRRRRGWGYSGMGGPFIGGWGGGGGGWSGGSSGGGGFSGFSGGGGSSGGGGASSSW
jgi:uncharacterized protein